MDSNNVVIKYLGTLGYNPSTSYYGYVELWKEWYENYVKNFMNTMTKMVIKENCLNLAWLKGYVRTGAVFFILKEMG